MPEVHFINDFKEFQNLLDHATPRIGFFGGRYVVYRKQTYTLNFLVKALQRSNLQKDQRKILIGKIRHLDEQAQLTLKNATVIQRLLTYLRQYFSHLFFDRNKELVKIEFDGKVPATSIGTYRLALLKGEKGTVACRVRGDGASPLPTISEWTIRRMQKPEWSVGSFLRMKNLIAVRGEEPGTRMTGPADYFGNVEEPHQHLFTIEINDQGIPVILREKMTAISIAQEKEKQSKINSTPFTTRIEVTWHKGSDQSTRAIHQKYQRQGQAVVGPSIFPDSGILEIHGERQIRLKKVDARTVDLSPFKARLVNNQTPFQIISEKLPVPDEYRAVSYLYEPQYAHHQVENGGGLFLETHQFVQTITPLDTGSKGFVTLAKWADDTRKALDIIGIEIPFGYTLIIDQYAIHGDTNLNGMFMMCMTSNHVTMQTADCVFLKHSATKKNVDISIEDFVDQQPERDNATAPRPIVTYDDSDKGVFLDHIKKRDVIFNYSLS